MTFDYQGNPDNAPFVIPLPDDSTGEPPTGSIFNTTFEPIDDLVANARAQLGGLMAGNWYAPVIAVPSNTDAAAYDFDPYGQRWLAVANASGVCNLRSSHDNGATWATVAGLSGAIPCAMLACGQTGDILIFSTGLATPQLDLVSLTATHTSSTGPAGFPASAAGIAVDYFHDVGPSHTGFFVDRHAFLFTQTGANFVGYWLTQADGSAVGSWNNESANLPAAFASGANHVGNFMVANTTRRQRVAVAGDVQALVLCGATPGTDTPAICSFTSTGSSAATIVDLTSHLPTSGSLGAPYIVCGFDYDPANALWGILLGTGASGSYLFSSPDLQTWTQVRHFPNYHASRLAQGGALAISNGVWAIWVGANVAIGTGESSNRIVYSWGVAARGAQALWKAAGMSLDPKVSGSVSNGEQHSKLYSNGFQLLAGQDPSSSAAQVQLSFDVGILNAGGSAAF